MEVATKVVIYISITITLSCTAKCQRLDPLTLHEVLLAAEWDSLHLLCDVWTSECPVEDIISVHPAIYISMDLTNHSLIVQMFETYASPTQLNWLVFCAHCEILLNKINAFEATHDLQGYFTYRYQWILIQNSRSALEDSLGMIMHLLIFDQDETLGTAMFGMKRYFQPIKNVSLQRKQLFPNLLTGMNNITLTFTAMPWPPYIVKDENGLYSGYYIELMNMIAEKLNFTFHMTEPADKNYGSLENGEWTGMVRQLVDKEADIAVVLTQSYERSLCVTQMNIPVRVGYELVIYHKPEPSSMSIDFIVKPFTFQVWLISFGIFILTMVMFHIAQVVLTSSQHKNFITSDNAAFILRSTLNQGSLWSPAHTSSRIIYGFYTVGWAILVAKYTAFLVSSLSV